MRHRPASAGCVAPGAQTGPAKAGGQQRLFQGEASRLRFHAPLSTTRIAFIASPAPAMSGIHVHFPNASCGCKPVYNQRLQSCDVRESWRSQPELKLEERSIDLINSEDKFRTTVQTCATSIQLTMPRQHYPESPETTLSRIRRDAIPDVRTLPCTPPDACPSHH